MSQVGVATVHPTLPYISTAMYKAAPTGLAPDAIVAGGTPQQQEAELAREIIKASAEMDSFCYGASGGTLRATVDTEMQRLRMDREGFFRLTPRFTPVLALEAFSSGDDPAAMTDLTDLSHVEVEQTRIRVPAYPFTTVTSAGPLQFGAMATTGRDALVKYSYTNGWPLTALTSAVTAGATTLTLDDVTGVYVGTRLVVRDPLVGDEAVIVSAVSGSDVTVSPLAQDHAAGVQVDALAQVLLDACIEITTGMLKRRSQQSVKVMRRTQRSSGAPVSQAQAGGYLTPESPGLDNFARGFGLLERFVQVRTR